MSTTLPLFWHLSSASQEDRIDASVKLVASLEQFQLQFVPKGSPETSDEEDEEDGTKTDGLDMLNAQDVSYSIRRLVRGLASPRESSRLGFAVALTEVSFVCEPKVNDILSLIVGLAIIQGRYCSMLPNRLDHTRLVQNSGIHDGPRRTGSSFRPALWPHICHPVWSACSTNTLTYLCIHRGSCFEPKCLFRDIVAAASCRREKILVTRKRLVDSQLGLGCIGCIRSCMEGRSS